MRPHYTPKLKKRTALLRELKHVFRRHRSQPIERVVSLINPMLRGWVNYFAVGNSSECFTYIRDWVEKKVRRQLAHARKRKGFGWERWSRPWLYDTLGLQISEFPTGDFGSNRQAVSVETDRPFRSKSAPRCGWVLVPTLANRRCVIHPILLWSAKASTLVIIIVSSDCCGRL